MKYQVTITDFQEAETPEEAAEAFIEQLRLGDYVAEDVNIEEIYD